MAGKTKQGDNLSELRILRALWSDAMKGDPAAEAKLLLFLSRYRSVDNFVKQFLHIKRLSDSNPPTTPSETRQLPTPWERGRENFVKGSPQFVSGGLPSLGKNKK